MTPATAPIDRLGLSDRSKFVTIPRVPIFRAHKATPKTTRDPSRASRANPSGVTMQALKADERDLAMMVRNANLAVAAGRPPVLQLGHTPLEDKPEPYQPKVIGLTSHYQLDELEGEPCIFADFHYRPENLQDATTYPRVSIERMGWDDPQTQVVSAVALIRRPPEIDLPLVPYSGTRNRPLVCYGRDLPFTSPGPQSMPPFKPDELAKYDRIIQAAGLSLPPVRRQAILDVVLAAEPARREGALRQRLAEHANNRGAHTGGVQPKLTPEERARFERIIDEFIAEGTIVPDHARAELAELAEAQPIEWRERMLRGQLGNYAKDPKARDKRINWMASRGLSGMEGRKAYAAAMAKESQVANYAAEKRRIATSEGRTLPSLVEFGCKIGVYDSAEVRRRYNAALADGTI